MNDEEIRLIKGYFNDGYCCDLDELKNIANKMIKENNKLQSNWNSLRECIEKQIEHYRYFKDNRYRRFLSELMNKMNELEGKDKK